MAPKPPAAFPPPGTLKAKLVNLIPRTNVAVYRWSKGRWGGTIQDLPVLILDTVGRKTGKPPQSPVLYVAVGADTDDRALMSRWGRTPMIVLF